MPESAVRLQLLAGPGIAVPVPRVVLDAVQEVKVESNSGETQSGFELTLSISNRSPLETLFLLTGGSSIPILRVVIAVTLGGTTSVETGPLSERSSWFVITPSISTVVSPP